MVKRLGISIFILFSIGALLYGLQIPSHKVIELAESIKSSPYSLPIFVIWTVFVCFVNVPLGVVTKLLSGWLFGFSGGFFIAYTSTMLGAFLAFRLARYLGREVIETHFSKSMSKLNARLNQGELVPLIQLRIFPFIPLPVANICLGVTSISTTHFIVSSLIGILPATLFYTYLGSQLVGFSSETLNFNSFLPYYIYILGALIFSFLLPFIFGKLKKREPPGI